MVWDFRKNRIVREKLYSFKKIFLQIIIESFIKISIYFIVPLEKSPKILWNNQDCFSLVLFINKSSDL